VYTKQRQVLAEEERNVCINGTSCFKDVQMAGNVSILAASHHLHATGCFTWGSLQRSSRPRSWWGGGGLLPRTPS